MICAGIDAGSRTVKVVLFDERTGKIVATGVSDQGLKQGALATQLLNQVLKKAGIARRRIERIIATGYGRDAVTCADTTVTEITCHACGVYHGRPDARTIVDIGGQDSKLLRLDGDGRVRDFMMNDRCAAGTGRFLEVVAARLGVQLDNLGKLAKRAKRPAPISSMCVVFAETEIIGLLASKETPANIVAGVQVSMATRMASMSGRTIVEPIIFTGGVALVPGMPEALAAAFQHPVQVARHPQLTGALGAAILAAR